MLCLGAVVFRHFCLLSLRCRILFFSIIASVVLVLLRPVAGVHCVPVLFHLLSQCCLSVVLALLRLLSWRCCICGVLGLLSVVPWGCCVHYSVAGVPVRLRLLSWCGGVLGILGPACLLRPGIDSSLLCWCVLALSVGPAAVGLGVSLSRQCILGRLLLLPGVVLVCSGDCVGVSSYCCARCALWRPLFPCAGGPVVLLLLGWVVPFVVWRCPFVSWQCPGAVTCLGGCLAGGSGCCCVGLAGLWVSLASLTTAWRRWSGVFLRLCVFQGLSVFVGPAPSSLASLRCLGCLGGRFVVLGECWVVEGL